MSLSGVATFNAVPGNLFYRTDDWEQGSSYPWVEPVGSEFLLRDTSRSHQWGNRLFNMGTFLAPGYNGHLLRVAFQYRF